MRGDAQETAPALARGQLAAHRERLQVQALAADFGSGPAAFAAAQKDLARADVLPRAVFGEDSRADRFAHAHAAAGLEQGQGPGRARPLWAAAPGAPPET